MLGFVVILLVTMTAWLLPAMAARAQSAECEETWDRLVAWSHEEANRGLSTTGLESLQLLLDEIEACSEDGTGAMGVDSERWRGLAPIYFDAGDIDRVICLMEKESGGNPNARNPSSGAAGLMQLMPAWAVFSGMTQRTCSTRW